MSADINESSSAELSVQPQEISLQPRVTVCPRCQHQRTADDRGPDWQCPSCGVAYNKATAAASAVVHQVISTSSTRRRQEVNRDPETETPSAISVSLQGRIGRLRYLAFSWPTIVLSALLGIMAAFTDPLHKTPGMILVIVVGVLWLWMPLRLMALRMHDLNQSAKWLLALILLPGLCFAAGKPQMGAVCSGFFWVVALFLILLPGSESDNDYGPPPGANTPLITVGAVLFLALMALGVVGNIELRRSGKLHSLFSRAPATARGPSESGNARNGR